MKKKKIAVLFCLMCVTILTNGCQKNKENTKSISDVEMSHSEDYIVGEDGCNNFWYDEGETEVIPTENGYYYEDNWMLCYFDKTTKQSMYVCSKPECEHSVYDDKCNANLFGYNNQIFLYKDKLYIVKVVGEDVKGLALEQISSDGTERETLYTFLDAIEEGGVEYTCYVHRGYFYYAISNRDGDKKKKVTVYRRALEKDAPKEVFYETEAYGITIPQLRAYGNEMYIRETGFRKKGMQDVYTAMKKCNIHTKKVETELENYYGIYVRMKDSWYCVDEDKQKLLRITGTEKKELCMVEDIEDTQLKTDGTYLYLYTCERIEKEDEVIRKYSVKILDTDGNVVATLKDTDEFVGADDEYLFFKKYEDVYSEEAGQEVAVNHTYYYQKSDIGSGDYSLRTEMKPE